MRVLQDANAELMRASLPGSAGAGAQLFAALADAKAALSLLVPNPQQTPYPKPSPATAGWRAHASAAANTPGSSSGEVAAARGEQGASALGGSNCGHQRRSASGVPLTEVALPPGVRTPVGWGALEGFGSGRALEASLEAAAASPELACASPDPAPAVNAPHEAAVPSGELSSSRAPLAGAHAVGTPAGGEAGVAAAAGTPDVGSGGGVAGSGAFAAKQQSNACSQQALASPGAPEDCGAGLAPQGKTPHGETPVPVSGSPLIGSPLSSTSWALGLEDDKENAPAAAY